MSEAKDAAAAAWDRALALELCPLCRVLRESEERRIWSFLYEHTGNLRSRKEFDREQGWCRYHAGLAARVARERELVSDVPLARLYETVVMTYQDVLTEAARAQTGGLFKRRTGKPWAVDCRECAQGRRAVSREISTLLKLLGAEERWAAYQRSDGLCVPHFELARVEAKNGLRALLLTDQDRRLTRLQGLLYQFQHKHSHDAPERPNSEEEAAWGEARWRFTGVAWDGPLVPRRK